MWELLMCEIPYKDTDTSAIIWGVGNNTLQLPIPEGVPDGMKLIMKMCWQTKPKNRPSFKLIISHLEITLGQVSYLSNPKEYFRQQVR